jgi:hypothetical protein
MFLEKIPRIECVLVIPELIEGELDNLIKEFDCNKKSLKILKKYKKRICTYNYLKNLLKYKNELEFQENKFEKHMDANNNFVSDEPYKIFKTYESIKLDDDEIISKLLKDYNLLEKFSDISLFNSFITSLAPNDKHKLTKFIIERIDKILNKYIRILVHSDDQTFVLSKQNKDNKKIFLKFFFPKITKDVETGSSLFNETINSLKDNIHMTLLPTIDGHGLDGLFHLTFRIEGKKSVVFEYSKYASLNIDSNKLGVGLYSDETCIDGLIFKIIQNLSKLVEIIKSKKFSNLDSNILNIQIYTSMLDFITLDILKKLNSDNKIEYIFEKYFYSLGKETIKTIIDKLFKIIIFTFVELYYGLE